MPRIEKRNVRQREIASMKPKMHELRAAGYKVKDIASALKVGTSTVYYALKPNSHHGSTYGWYDKIRNFHRVKVGNKCIRVKATFTKDDFLKKIGPNPKSVWTGDPIDINDFDSWEMNHYPTPKSRGGSNTIDNCDISTHNENMSVGEMLREEVDTLYTKTLQYNFHKTVIDEGDERRWILENARKYGLLVSNLPV